MTVIKDKLRGQEHNKISITSPNQQELARSSENGKI